MQLPSQAFLDALERASDRPRSAAALARAVAELSAVYNGRAPGRTDSPAALEARLRFFMPRDLPKVAAPLLELAAAGALPPDRPWRLLDLGAGLGTATFAAASIPGCVGVDALAVDRDAAALRAMQRVAALAPEGLAPLTLRTEIAPLDRVPAAGDLDLIVLSLVLTELDEDAAAVATRLRTLCGRLSPGGSLVVIEPALRPQSRRLQEARDLLEAAPSAPRVFAPCTGGEACPLLARDRDWCHQELPLPLPPALAEVARAAGLRRERLTYSYLTLRRDGRRLAELAGGAATRVVSAPRASKGKLELWGCGQGRAAWLMRLDRHRSEANRPFESAGRGALLAIEGASGGPDRLRIGRDTRVSIVHAPLKLRGEAP